MPLVIGAAPIGLTLNVQDYNGENAVTEVFFPQSVGIDNMAAEVAAHEAVLAALTDGFITGGGITIPLIQNTPVVGVPPATSNIQRKGKFVFRNNAGTYNTYQIPSIDRAFVVAGSDSIDVDAAAVEAYINMMLLGLGVLGAPPVGGGGQDLASFVRAYEDTSRANRRGRRS